MGLRPVLDATRVRATPDAVAGPFLTTSRTTSLRRCSQTVTPLRPKQRASGTTTLLSLPLLSSSPMALVLPTSTGTSWEPRKSLLFLPMLAPKPPVSSVFFFFPPRSYPVSSLDFRVSVLWTSIWGFALLVGLNMNVFRDFFFICLWCHRWRLKFCRSLSK